MDRQFVYPGQIPLETDLLNTNRNVMVALGALIGDLFGTNTVFSGLSVVPTIPASMSVTVNPGHVYSLQNIDNTAYSSLSANEAQQIMKQGLLATAQTLAMTAPVTAGQSVNYLISAAFVEQDIGPTVLPYYNAANPQVAWSGPGGLGGLNNTTRQDTVALTLMPGVPAVTGTQTTPATPTGTTPLYVVTVANGATTIVAANISNISGVPILPSGVLQSLITSNLTYGIDNGSANTIQATFPIPVTTLIDGIDVWVKIKAANTGATTFTPNPGVIAAAPVVGAAHLALQGGETVAGGRANMVYRADITSWVMVECTGGADQIAPAAASQHAVQLGQIAVFGSARNLKASLSAAGTSLTVTADAITVKSALNGISTLLTSYSETVNLATTGAGGMDTGAAPVSGFVALYATWGPAVGAGIVATNATAAAVAEQYGGTAQPAGVTETQLISVWPTNASGQLIIGLARNRKFSTAAMTFLNTTTVNASPTAIPCNVVPKNAVTVYGNEEVSSSSTAGMSLTLSASATAIGEQIVSGYAIAGTGIEGNFVIDLITPQILYCNMTVAAGTLTSVASISAYEI